MGHFKRKCLPLPAPAHTEALRSFESGPQVSAPCALPPPAEQGGREGAQAGREPGVRRRPRAGGSVGADPRAMGPADRVLESRWEFLRGAQAQIPLVLNNPLCGGGSRGAWLGFPPARRFGESCSHTGSPTPHPGAWGPSSWRPGEWALLVLG